MSPAGGGPGRLTVLAGPTAVGKGTITAWIREHHPEIWISVSATTRSPRPGEVDGVHYRFVSEAEFDALVAEDELLEWAVVHRGARYGTPRGPVLEALAAVQGEQHVNGEAGLEIVSGHATIPTGGGTGPAPGPAPAATAG